MQSIVIEDFSLEYTLESGQYFLFEKLDESFYEIINRNTIFKVKQEGNKLFFEGISSDDLSYFFSLDVNLKELTADFTDKYLKEALTKYWGLRLIRQDLWQCIIGFVCSSASNIPKIKTNLRLICEEFGDSNMNNRKVFPKVGQINDLERLKKTKTGFRAKYIYSINEILIENPNILSEIESSEYIEAKRLLKRLPGIGDKVADCICLFALGHKEAFPIDTWVKQIIEKLYLGRESENLEEVEKYISTNFNGFKGLKQQYLFHYIRNQ